MVIVNYEGVNFTNKDFEEKIIEFVESFLQEHIDILHEIVFTNDMKITLEKRLSANHYQKWVDEKEKTYYQTAGKAFNAGLNNKRSIAILCYDGIESILYQRLVHELCHVLYYAIVSDYKLEKSFSPKEEEKIDIILEMLSEYMAENAEAGYNKSHDEIPPLEMYDLDEEAQRVIDRYKELKPKKDSIFQEGMKIAIAEFDNILIRHLGRCDGLEKSAEFDKEVSTGLVNSLFGDSIINMCELIRSFSFEDDLLAIASELEKHWNQQTDELNMSINFLL